MGPPAALAQVQRAINSKLPKGPAGLAIRVAVGLLAALWWTSAPGAEEASDLRANSQPRKRYSRHFAFKGRGRKRHVAIKSRNERVQTRPSRRARG